MMMVSPPLMLEASLFTQSLFSTQKTASGGEVCHLESGLANVLGSRSSSREHSLPGCVGGPSRYNVIS